MATDPATLRREQAVILSRMLLTIMRVTFAAYDHGPNIGAVFSQMLVSWAVRAQGARQKTPVSISKIARITGLPRPTIRRCTVQLIKLGTITKCGTGYVSNPQWIDTKIKPNAITRASSATLAAAD